MQKIHWTYWTSLNIIKHLGAWKCLIFQGYGTRQAQGIRPLLSWKKAHMSTCHSMASKCMSTVNGVFTSDQVKLAAGWRLQISGQGHVEMWIIWIQLRIPKLHRNSLSRKVFGDTQWRTYQEFGELCKACRAETGSNFPCGVCNAWAIFVSNMLTSGLWSWFASAWLGVHFPSCVAGELRMFADTMLVYFAS